MFIDDKLLGEVFWHNMSVPREIRYEYIKELNNSYKVGRDDTSKHKGMMIRLIKDKIVYMPTVYGNIHDNLY